MTYCPHGMNPASCPDCWKNKPQVVQPAKPGTRPDVPLGPVMAVGEATMRATLAKRPPGPVVAQSNGRTFKEPYSERRAVSPEAFGGDRIWEPPVHRNLMDAQPRHPHAGEERPLPYSPPSAPAKR